MKRHFLSAVIACAASLIPVITAQADIIPVEAFAALPSFSDAQLSPNGQTIAYATDMKGRKTIVIRNMDGSGGGVLPPNGDMNIDGFSWINDDVLLVKYGGLMNRVNLIGETYNTRVYAFSPSKGNFVWLGDPDTLAFKERRNEQLFTSQLERVIDYLPDDPDHLLIQLDLDLNAEPEVYKVNIHDGIKNKVRSQKRGVQHWYTDQDSEVRLGVGYDNRDWVGFFQDTDGSWASLDNVEWAQQVDIEGFAADRNFLFVSGRSEHGTSGLYKLDLRTGEIAEEIFTHETVDVAFVVPHPVTGRIAGVAYTDDFLRVQYFDNDLAKLQRGLDKALPGSVNTIVSVAPKANQYLLRVESAQNPGDYYIYDRNSKQLSYLTPRRNGLDPAQAAPTKGVTIPVRDGSEIPGYLTLPLETKGKKLPAIIMPHGGPAARDSAEWDYWAQFYASRGYAVLKPNFRGSTGYGADFQFKGLKQWGGLMQDDVTDATKWLIAEGIADPERICIVGASYGGYAALMGTIKEPGLYKCAISVNGVTDIPRMKVADANFIGGRAWGENMTLEGAKDKDISPYHRAEEINVPVMLLSSEDDERVPHKLSQTLHKKLKKLKKKARYIELKDGGHSMTSKASRAQLLTETGKFLDKHIGD